MRRTVLHTHTHYFDWDAVLLVSPTANRNAPPAAVGHTTSEPRRPRS
ncbi:hypothetical protein PAA8504_03365 [Palleronia abyssalis]|uniref:Uncharacterized protein n=1 Tax=Palleronia abyssalis TaxID=1501240 RepID=A0A2R8BZE2_9RHOB|nr:hypothetical protein PAA8504_03365 [Palleronia abyssalis]